MGIDSLSYVTKRNFLAVDIHLSMSSNAKMTLRGHFVLRYTVGYDRIAKHVAIFRIAW